MMVPRCSRRVTLEMLVRHHTPFSYMLEMALQLIVLANNVSVKDSYSILS